MLRDPPLDRPLRRGLEAARPHAADLLGADEATLLQDVDVLHDHRLVSVSLTTIEFFAAGDGTRLVFTEQGAFFDDVGDAAEREHGTGKLLDRLERLLAGEPVR